jgi:hypothetical protein
LLLLLLPAGCPPGRGFITVMVKMANGTRINLVDLNPGYCCCCLQAAVLAAASSPSWPKWLALMPLTLVIAAAVAAAAAAACRLPSWPGLHHRHGQDGQRHPYQCNSVRDLLPRQQLTWRPLQYCEVHALRGRQDNDARHTQDFMWRCAATILVYNYHKRLVAKQVVVEFGLMSGSCGRSATTYCADDWK